RCTASRASGLGRHRDRPLRGRHRCLSRGRASRRNRRRARRGTRRRSPKRWRAHARHKRSSARRRVAERVGLDARRLPHRIAMADLGTTLALTTDEGLDLDPSFGLVSGRRALAQAILARLDTPQGALWYDPDYGRDLKRWLNESFAP